MNLTRSALLMLLAACGGTDGDPLPEQEREIINCVTSPFDPDPMPCERACVGLEGPQETESCAAAHPKSDELYGCSRTFLVGGVRGCCVIFRIEGDTVNVWRFFACEP